MKVFITGANGFLGQHLSIYMHNNKYEVYAVSRGENKIPDAKISYFNLELTNKELVIAMITTIRPDVIIHTAAMSKPDECHLNRETCLLNNVTVTEYLLEAAKQVSARFIYISTDFVSASITTFFAFSSALNIICLTSSSKEPFCPKDIMSLK